MTIEDIKSKYCVSQADAIGDYKYFNVFVKFDGISIEKVRAKNPDEAGRFAVRNVKDRCSGVTGNANVNAKVSKTELA